MKKYGLRIGDVGIEFPSIEERNEAVKNFILGSDVTIHSSGIRYRPGVGTFSIYDRDDKEILITCQTCLGIFNIESCNKRDFPKRESWERSYSIRNDYICDACLVIARKDEELYKKGVIMEE